MDVPVSCFDELGHANVKVDLHAISSVAVVSDMRALASRTHSSRLPMLAQVIRADRRMSGVPQS